jgi:hypothetical protein
MRNNKTGAEPAVRIAREIPNVVAPGNNTFMDFSFRRNDKINQPGSPVLTKRETDAFTRNYRFPSLVEYSLIKS